MIGEEVWVCEKCVGPRLRSDELWLMYRLVDGSVLVGEEAFASVYLGFFLASFVFLDRVRA